MEGGVAVGASGSRLEMAEVEVEGREAAVTASQRSYVVFSLSRVRSPRTRGDVHDFYAVTESNPLWRVSWVRPCSAAMRSSIGGWLEKSAAHPGAPFTPAVAMHRGSPPA